MTIAKAALAEACAEAPKSTAQVEIRVVDHGSGIDAITARPRFGQLSWQRASTLFSTGRIPSPRWPSARGSLESGKREAGSGAIRCVEVAPQQTWLQARRGWSVHLTKAVVRH